MFNKAMFNKAMLNKAMLNKAISAFGLEFRIFFEYEEIEGNRCVLDITSLELIDKKGIIDISSMLEEKVVMSLFEDALMKEIHNDRSDVVRRLNSSRSAYNPYHREE